MIYVIIYMRRLEGDGEGMLEMMEKDMFVGELEEAEGKHAAMQNLFLLLPPSPASCLLLLSSPPSLDHCMFEPIIQE